MKKKQSLSVVILVASLLLAVTLLDTWILYTQTNRQTRQSGAYQLEAMSGKLESTISDAKDLTMSLAIKAREYLGDKSALERFIYAEKDEILTYDVSFMINDLFNSIFERAKKKGLEFVLNVDSTIPCELFGDDVRIRQVIMNLLTNAVKYTEKGKVTLTISGEVREEEKYLLKVSCRIILLRRRL